MKLVNLKRAVDLTGYALIIPSISVGNVPQLTVDLLITSLKLENVATLWHPGLVASVGADPFYSNDKIVCTACELYINEALKLATIQFRSTIETKLVLKFLRDFIDSISELQFKHIYILATGFDYELHNIANRGTYYFATNDVKNEESLKSIASVEPLEQTGKIVVNGAGFAPQFYELIGDKIQNTLLVKYVSEGENIYDANCFITKLFDILGIKLENGKALSYPSSWHYVYGAPPPLGLF